MRVLSGPVCLLAALLGLNSFPSIAQPVQRQGDDPITKEVGAMHWVRSGVLRLPNSSSTVSLPSGFFGVAGDEAVRLEQLAEAKVDRSVEGIVLNQSDDTVVFQYSGEGYITLDDWTDLNSSDLIREIGANTEEQNKVRKEKSLAPIHVTGWLQEPTLDRSSQTVFWAIAAYSEDGSKLVNSIALRLGRSGFEKIVWITTPNSYKTVGGTLDVMLRAHNFDQGQRYQDHAEGDRLAGYGIAALVGTVAGVKLAKIAAAGGILLLIKKFWFLLFAGVAIFFRKIKGLFNKAGT